MDVSGSSWTGLTRGSLVSRVARQDQAAWRDLVRLYGPLVGSWCRRGGLDWHAAADCVQDVFVAVARGIERFEHPGTSGAFRGWLCTITRRKLIDHQRRGQHQTAGRGGSTALRRLAARADPETLPEEQPTGAVELDRLISRGIDQVRCEFQSQSWRAFWRSAVDGIPTATVAEELAMTPAAVRQCRSRILRRLRQQLDGL